MSVCINCGGSNLIDDAQHFESHKVCTDCGTLVLSEAHFDWTAGVEGGAPAPRWDHTRYNTLPDVVSRHQRSTAPSRVCREALARLHNMSSAHNLTRPMRDEAIRLFQKAYDHAAFNSHPRETKILLAGCCVYVVARQHSWPLSLYYVASYLQVHTQQLNATFKRLLATFELTVPSPDIEDMVEPFVAELVVTGLRGCEKSRLVDLMRRTLRLSRLTQLSTSVCYRPLLECVAYVSWRHLAPEKSQVKGKSSDVTSSLAFVAFCSDCGLVPNSTSRKRLTEINGLLTSLRDQIPWISEKQRSKKYLYTHLDSILRFSHALVKSHAIERTAVEKEPIETDEKDCSSASPIVANINHEDSSTTVVDSPSCEMVLCMDNVDSVAGETCSKRKRVDECAANNAEKLSCNAADKNSSKSIRVNYESAGASSICDLTNSIPDDLESNSSDDVASDPNTDSSSLNSASKTNARSVVESIRTRTDADVAIGTRTETNIKSARPLFRRQQKRKWPQEPEMEMILSKSRLAALESTELSQDDLLDSEMGKYIRTASEVRFISKLKNRLDSSSSDEDA